MPPTLHPFFVTCEPGAEGALRRELVNLRIRGPKGARAGVFFRGTFEEGMRICLHARTAMRVLLELAAFDASSVESLYEAVYELPWQDHLGADHTFAVRAQVSGSAAFTNSQFAALKAKDAIVDRLRVQLGRRPNVDPRDPDLQVALHVNGTQGRLFLDLAGAPLHRRGYRVSMTEAPLKETLAASVLALGNVSPEAPFLDPMAGSGTLAIEHALRARHKAPGLDRSFGFERWPSLTMRSEWTSMKEAARAAVLPRAPAPIWVRDHDPAALEALRENAAAAGVLGDLQVETAALSRLTAPAPQGTLCTNPPYGERLDRGTSGHDDVARDLALALHRVWGWAAVVLVPDPLFARTLTVRPAFSHRLWNGGLEVRLMRFELGTAAATDDRKARDS